MGAVPPLWGHEPQIIETGFYTLGHREPVSVSAGGDFKVLEGRAILCLQI